MNKRRRRVEKKKINLPFYLVVIVFLVFIIILINDFKAQRANDYKVYKTVVANIIKMENDRIRILAKENADLKNTLANTRNELDALSKKLAQPALKP